MQNTELAIRTGETAGDYRISHRVRKAAGVYEFSAGKLEWKEPQEENARLEVVVNDAGGRFVPGLSINATLLDKRGARAAAAHLPFVWDPEQNHYGANVKVPEPGEYLLQVHVFPATFMRADQEQGKRFVSDADAQFEGVRIEF